MKDLPLKYTKVTSAASYGKPSIQNLFENSFRHASDLTLSFPHLPCIKIH